MTNKIRKGWIAGILTFLAVGLGHIYSGEPMRGFMLFVGQGLCLLLLPLVFIIKPLSALVIIIIFSFSYFLFCFIDSIKCARSKSLSYQQRKYNKWYIYCAYWFVTSLIIQPVIGAGIKTNVLQAYKIPAGSMLPTLLIGDHVLVNKFIYKKNKPQRGDIAVFEFPKDPSKDFIKRIVAVGNDVVEIRDKKLYINNVLQKEHYVRHTDTHFIPATDHPRDNFGPYNVPSNSFFMLGDNRDNSFDSRFWGIVKSEKIKGKAFCFYWSWDSKSSQIRWERIGKSIETQ